MSKSRKEILLELLELENEKAGSPGNLEVNVEKHAVNPIEEIKNSVTENAVSESITKPKRQLTEKQLEALKRGQEKRDENARLRKDAAEKKAAEDKLKLEQKIVKKAISIKKKELKRQAALDAVSDDETPIEKIKELGKPTVSPKTPSLPEQPPVPVRTGPIIRFF